MEKMFKTQIRIVTVVLLLLLIPQVALAETTVEAQTIDSNVTWTLSGSPYKVTGNVTVNETGTLEIEPGVVVEMGAGISMTISGRFFAQGTESLPITLKWATEGVHWGNLYFTSSSLSVNVLFYCKVIGATKIDLRSSLTLSNNTVEQNSDHGIYISGSSPNITNNNIGLNKDHGVFISSGSPVIENNLIADNGGHGIHVYSYSAAKPTIRFNTIDANDRGISFEYTASDHYSGATVKNNIITNNIIGIHGGSAAQFGYNNVWQNNTDYSYSATAAATDISADPLYADYLAEDLSLQSNSSCLTTSDTGGEMGAYGNGGEPPPTQRSYSTMATTSGSLTENERWSGAVSLTGTVTVPRPYTLMIDPGTTVSFADNAGITVNSMFFALGTSSEPITFKWTEEDTHWGSLYFTTSSSPANILSHCRVVGATKIDIRSSLTVTSSTVEQNSDHGIYISGSSPTVTNNNIGLNKDHGVFISSGSPVIENNLITDNGGYGIHVYSYSAAKPTIRFNTIDANDRGISFEYTASDHYSGATVKNNIITNNIIGIHGGSAAQFGYNNVWQNNTDYSYSATAAETDISVDPLYVDYWGNNFHLQDDSPCKTASKDKTEIGAYAGVDGEIGIYGIGPYDPVPVEVTLTSPNTTTIYYPDDTLTIAWETTNAAPSDNMVVSMKRNAVAEILTEPDGVDWYRFIENTENDGFEEVTIPSGVAAAEDWRFYVRHADSDAYDASDENFTLVQTSCYLTLTKGGEGTGTVTSKPEGMNCGPDCSEQEGVYACGTEITLTATPGKGHVFSGWSGHCTGKDTCSITLEGTMAVTAFFIPSGQILGDVNGDGEITPGDAVDAYELSKKFSWTEAEIISADFNGDGEITPQDAVSIYEKSKEF